MIRIAYVQCYKYHANRWFTNTCIIKLCIIDCTGIIEFINHHVHRLRRLSKPCDNLMPFLEPAHISNHVYLWRRYFYSKFFKFLLGIRLVIE